MNRKEQFMCESCGTVAATRTKATRLDRLLRQVSGHTRFACGHCGWTGLRNWSHAPAAIANHATPRLDSPEHDATAIESGLELLAAGSR
jgi:hypothetical protein